MNLTILITRISISMLIGVVVPIIGNKIKRSIKSIKTRLILFVLSALYIPLSSLWRESICKLEISLVNGLMIGFTPNAISPFQISSV